MKQPRPYPKLRFHCPAPPQIDPADRQTWCEHCERHVHNLSAMSEAEQSALLASPHYS